jgi:hypothetical protein
MRMFNVVPRLIKNTVKNLTHFTCNSPVKLRLRISGKGEKCINKLLSTLLCSFDVKIKKDDPPRKGLPRRVCGGEALLGPRA